MGIVGRHPFGFVGPDLLFDAGSVRRRFLSFLLQLVSAMAPSARITADLPSIACLPLEPTQQEPGPTPGSE